jgi:hypothetical protein
MVLDEKNDAEHNKLIILRPILVDITALTEAEYLHALAPSDATAANVKLGVLVKNSVSN